MARLSCNATQLRVTSKLPKMNAASPLEGDAMSDFLKRGGPVVTFTSADRILPTVKDFVGRRFDKRCRRDLVAAIGAWNDYMIRERDAGRFTGVPKEVEELMLMLANAGRADKCPTCGR